MFNQETFNIDQRRERISSFVNDDDPEEEFYIYIKKKYYLVLGIIFLK